MPRKNKTKTTTQTLLDLLNKLVAEGIEIIEGIENLTTEQNRQMMRAIKKFGGASEISKRMIENAEEAEG